MKKTHGLDIRLQMTKPRGRFQSASQPAVLTQPVDPLASQQKLNQPSGPASQPMDEDQPEDQSLDMGMEEEPPGYHSPPPGPSGTPDSQGTQASQQPPPPITEDPPTLEEAHRTHIPTIIHIPKAARGEFTRVLTDLYVRLAKLPEVHTLWTLLLIFPRAILYAGRSPRQADARSQAKQVLSRLSRWRHGEYRQLWEEAIAATTPPSKSKHRVAEEDKSQEQRNVMRATKLAQQGQYTRSLQALTSAGLAQQDSATVEALKAKHPVAENPPTSRPQSDTPQMSFSPAQVYKVIRSFNKGSAPGPSGLRAEHLKAIVRSAPPDKTDKATEAITKLVNIMVAGKVPRRVAPFLCGARLHAGKKKDGGIRPIAVNNILRRLTSKTMSFAISERAATTLSPHQLGVGVRGGSEAIIHTVRQVVEEGNADKWVLQVDLINAFNLADRDAGFAEVERLFPDCFQWIQTSYGVEAELMFGDTVILSSKGFQQGDPLASLLFSLVLHPIIERIQLEVPTLDINTWYLDDGVLVGKKEDLQKVVDILTIQGPTRGLFLNKKEYKSTVWCPGVPATDDDPLDRNIFRTKEPGIILLGSPIGSTQFIQQAVSKRTEKIREITDLLPLLEDAHTEFVLLRSCLSLPKIMYTLRTVDPTPHQAEWMGFDSITREALTRILGAPLDDIQWLQATLPVSMGGLGLRTAEDHGPGAYASSFLSSQPIRKKILGLPEVEEEPVSLPPALLTLLNTKLDEEVTADTLEGVPQRTVSRDVDLHNQKRLLTTVHSREGMDVERETARLASLSLPHSGDYLNVVPSPALGLHLRTAEFNTVTKYRLGCPIYPTAEECPVSTCHQHSDRMGDHAISCGSQGERTARHNHLRDILYHTAVSASLGPTKEGRFLVPGTDGRPADVLIPHWTGGKDSALDVTVINPLQSATVTQAAIIPGHALTVAYDRKIRKAGEACKAAGIAFLPLPVETLGGWHDNAVPQIKKLGSALARQQGRTEQEETETIHHLFQRLAISLMKGNASLLINRFQTFPTAQVDGDME